MSLNSFIFESTEPQKEGADAAPVGPIDTFICERSQGRLFSYERFMSSPGFGSLLESLIERRGLSVNEWAEKHANMTNGHAFNMIAGRRRPAMDEVGFWADTLHLKGQERQHFLDFAAMAHLPLDVQPRFHAIYAEHQRLKAQYLELLNLSETRRVADGS